MSLFIRLTLTAAAVFSLASCGGGDASAPPQPSSGWVVDGYLSGATVLCDVNGSGVADAGDITVTTDGGGKYTFPAPGCAQGMGAVGGTDVDTGLRFRGVMKAPAGATVITPLTTLLVGGMSQERLIATLQLRDGINLPHADPGLDPALMRKSLVVAQLLIKTTEMFAGLGGVDTDAALQAIHNEVAVSFAILLQGGGSLVVGTEVDQALVAQLVKAATQRVASSPAVAAAVKNALTALNAESLGIVAAGGLTVQAEHILKAADADLTANATASLSDPTITDFMKANAAQLTAAPTAATLALSASLSTQVSQNLGETPAPGVPATLPVDFDGATPVPFVGFNGAEGSTIEAGPANGTGKSLRILRSGGEVYAGAYITTVPIPFAADRKTLTARVYSPKAGVRMVLKVEGAEGLTSAEYDATPAVVVGWQTLTWVATGVDLTKSYTKITMLPNLGVVDAAPGQSYYFDDITLVTDSVTPPPASALPLPISFDEATSVPFLGFNGAEGSTIEAGPAGGNGKSLRILRSGGQVSAGAFITTAPIPFAADRKTLTARVHSPKAGVRMVLKVEGADGLTSAEYEATPAVVVGWQTLTWVATGVDLTKSYTKITMLPNFGVVDAAPGQSYYFDDITLVTDSVTPPPASALPLPISFDEATPPVLGQFGNGAAVTVAAGPTGGSGNAARFTKTAGDTWAGFFFPTATIAFTSTSKTITARVYSPKVGAPMVMKVEGPGGATSAEVAATPATVVGWQTLRWVFTGLDLTKIYNSIAILPDSGNVGSGQVYYFDDITLVTDSVTPPPVSALPLPISFDEATPPVLGQFGNGAAVTVAAGPAGGSGNAARFTKTAGDTWAGFYFPTATIPFTSTSRTITARVHSPKAGAPMVMKVEGPGGTTSAEVAATPATVVGWQTLRWVFTGLDLTKTYNSIAILPDSGNVGSGQVYHFDDVTLVADSTNYLALVADSISLVNGAVKNVYTMNQFESAAGISVGWPIPSPTLAKVALTEVGSYTLPADQKVSAAVSITETVSGGKGEIQAFIDNVGVRKTATGLEVAIPATSANALVYSVSSDGKKKLVIDFGSSVAGIKQELTTAANMTNSLVFGEVMQYAINQISNDFSGIYQLRGKYKVTVVISGMPLRRADGTELPTLNVVVPTELNNTGGVAASRTITGPGLTGYVTLTD